MLKILEGKKIKEASDLASYIEKYSKVVIDVGTGNGKFVYDLALRNPDILYIGIDPAADNLMEYSKKAQKNLTRKGQCNLIYLISSIENLDPSLTGIADELYVNFPWGSLLEGVVKGQRLILDNLAMLASSSAKIRIIFSYSSIHEPVEMAKRELPELSPEYLSENLKDLYNDSGIEIVEFGLLDEKSLMKYGTLWSKKLYLGKSRDVYYLDCRLLI